MKKCMALTAVSLTVLAVTLDGQANRRRAFDVAAKLGARVSQKVTQGREMALKLGDSVEITVARDRVKSLTEGFLQSGFSSPKNAADMATVFILLRTRMEKQKHELADAIVNYGEAIKALAARQTLALETKRTETGDAKAELTEAEKQNLQASDEVKIVQRVAAELLVFLESVDGRNLSGASAERVEGYLRATTEVLRGNSSEADITRLSMIGESMSKKVNEGIGIVEALREAADSHSVSKDMLRRLANRCRG